MAEPESPDLSAVQAELERLRAENERLRAKLAKQGQGTQPVEALKFGGSFLIPMFDRQRVFRTFVAFFDEASFYTLSQEHWPPRERVIERARDFGLAILRFFVKRRLVILLFSLLAFMVPLVQVWLVFQQNAIIENQNKYFNIQVYDIVARSLTGSDTTAKQITSSLLAREDFGLVNGIIRSVFESQSGGSFTEADVTGDRTLFLEETGARGHLVSALSQALEQQRDQTRYSTIWSNVEETFGLVTNDAQSRVPQLLRVGGTAASKDVRVRQDCFRYLFSLTTLMQRGFALSHTVNKEDEYWKSVAPVVGRLSSLRFDNSDTLPFKPVFVALFSELLYDLANKPKFGESAPKPEDQNVERQLREGFKILVQKTKAAGASVNDTRLKQLLEVP